MICELTGMECCNASMYDGATAAAEAMLMSIAHAKKRNKVIVSQTLNPRVIEVIETYARFHGVNLEMIPEKEGVTDKAVMEKLLEADDVAGVIASTPNRYGIIEDFSGFADNAHAHKALFIVYADPSAMAVLKTPGEWGADIAIGSSQRLGTPMFYGGPSAAYFATRDEYKRNMPGRIIGLSKDKYGHLCYRMALQTREQHIKREKATSNICTAQALLATMAGFYAVYHGPDGIKEIANHVHAVAFWLAEQLTKLGYKLQNENFFDTLRIQLPDNVTIQEVRTIALSKEINLRYFDNGDVGISVDETTTQADATLILNLFAVAAEEPMHDVCAIPGKAPVAAQFQRLSTYLTHEVFQKYHTETEMMRYIKRLERKDISLAHSMISLGSCTMKLNAASEMLPLSNAAWMNLRPLVPEDQAAG